jgi:hypothetical protein
MAVRWRSSSRCSPNRPHRTLHVVTTIIRYWHSEDVPEEIAALLAGFDEQNPDLHQLVFHEASAERLIAAHFGAREVAAFRACAVPAMQADYFRCCAVHSLGGVYADADLRCVGALSTLVDDLDGGQLVGWRRMPGRFADLGMSDEAIFGPTDRVGPYRWLENGFFAFPSPGHPFLELAVEMMTAHIESRATENLFAATGPGVFTSLYLLRELGSFDAFVQYASHGVLAPVAQLSCDAIDDYGRIERAFKGVRLSLAKSTFRWVRHAMPAYKDTEAHWLRWPASISR